ncbi:MAG: thioesterase family protein, partial [Nitriliruptor sp.]
MPIVPEVATAAAPERTTSADGVATPHVAAPGRYDLRVRYHELDPNGHVNHGVYANYLETARIDLMESIGFGPQVLTERGVHLVVVELRIRFRRPALAGDRLTIDTRVAELRPASSWWHQSIRRGDELLTEAEVRSSAGDASGRPCRPP